MSEINGEQEESTQAEIQPVTIVEDKVHTKEAKATSSRPDEKEGEKPTASERSDEEDKSQANGKLATRPKEEEATSIPVAKRLRKLRCCDPTDTVDIAIEASGFAAVKPMTVPQFLQKTCDKLPNGVALCWKDRKEEPWRTLTYAQYKKLIYNVAKSFLKVMYCSIKTSLVCNTLCYDGVAWTGAFSFSVHYGLQLCRMVCI